MDGGRGVLVVFFGKIFVNLLVLVIDFRVKFLIIRCEIFSFLGNIIC